ncbi:MAG: hypothetical protein HWD90_02695 [Campylobacteraceae bacterium]|nr:hypothetical protein [Campylobacteraceae bacterium]
MNKKENKLADYTTIKHHPRVKHKLSTNDYCIANAIYHLCNNPLSKFPGWYYGKVETLSEMFNLSRASGYNSVNKLIEKNKESGFLKTTKLWWDDFVNFEIGQESKF